MSHCDNGVSDRSGRRNNHVPNSNTRRQRQRKTRSQGRVERRREVDERGSQSTGRTDEEEAAARGPGRSATDQGASSVSLAVASHEKDSPKTNIDTSKPPPSPPTTPSLLFEQTASTSRQPTHQRSRNGHVPRNGTRHTHEVNVDVEGSRGRAELRSRGYRETNDNDSSDVDVHHADEDASGHVKWTTGQVQRSRGRQGNGEKDERASGIADPSSDVNGGDEDVHHTYVVPDSTRLAPYPDKPRPPPPSTLLEGEEKNSQQQPRQTPYDQRLNGEGRGEGRRQKEEARDAARRDDEEGLETREVEGTPNEGKERTTVTSVNEDDAVHDPGGETDTPGSVPPSVRLVGERNRVTSLNVEPDSVETVDNEVDEMKPSRNHFSQPLSEAY
ncbi:hypothetical protein PAXINDRAFT_18955 [Paxillus involutus ATCC 200175]|uniref:Uncharacterized protein n=1 Tax=Paxillus involutus ATCC 200175 TaxID=664439 RepID=A0A0C9TKG9_PAXIN|nr:hypothetical protein PAXINDRAFT_18955 [Paxillus involutus ATCC 200175]